GLWRIGAGADRRHGLDGYGLAPRPGQAGGAGKEEMNRWILVAPIAAFLVLAFFLFKSLWSPAPDVVPSALLNKPAPRLVLPGLDSQSAAFTPADLAAGHV